MPTLERLVSGESRNQQALFGNEIKERRAILKIATSFLITFDRLEQGLEITNTKALDEMQKVLSAERWQSWRETYTMVATLDDFEEQRWTIFDRLGKYL